MKRKIIIVIISILLVKGLISQDYIPLAVEGAHWVILYDEIESIQPVDDLWEYHALGDTIINNLTYKKIFKRDLVVTQDGPPFEAEGTYQLFGVIRDDTTNRKVYAIQFDHVNGCPDNEEYLIYDFSKSIGDTIDLCIIPDWKEFVIDDIYFQEIFGFNSRIYTDGDWDELYEGMGSNFGLFEEMFAPFKKSTRLYVYHTFLYYYCRESPCWLFVSLNETWDNNSIKLFPNPAQDFISIATSEEINSVKVFNNLGQTIMYLKGDVRKLDLQTITPGLYIFEIQTNETSVVKKVYIE